jgi:small subunit ribosomal protein S17
MAKQLKGVVVKIDMKDTALVEVTRKVAHPMYRKLLKRSKKYKADTTEVKVGVGDTVNIIETRPLSKDKHFKVASIVSTGGKS